MAVDKIQELNEERADVYKSITELAERQAEWGAEERSQWDQLNARFDEINDEASEIRSQAERAARLDEINEQMERDASRTRTEVGQRRQELRVQSGHESPTEQQRCLALQGWLMRNNIQTRKRLTEKHEAAMELCRANEPEELVVDCFRSAPHGHQLWSTGNGQGRLPYKERDLEAGVDAEGGFTVPEGFMAELERTMLAFGGLRAGARIISTSSGNLMPWPTVNDTGNTGVLLPEEGSIGTSVDPTFGVVNFSAYKYSSKPVIISAELLEDSAFNLAIEIASMLGERLGRITSAQFATGTGSSQPQGISVGASAGVTAASATVPTAAELISLQQTLDPAYENPSTAWVMNKTTVGEIRALTEAVNGQFLWQPGLQAGVPDMLLGHPVLVVQDMPDSTTGLVPIVYGDLSKFVIRDAGAFRFYRLEELYRATDQTGFIGFSRHDSHVIQASALKKMTMA